MDAQMKKGVLELCLLQCLSGEPKYGYDVIQTMRAYFPEVTESTFYAVLRRLHKEALPGRRVQRAGAEVLPPHRSGPGAAGATGGGLAAAGGDYRGAGDWTVRGGGVAATSGIEVLGLVRGGGLGYNGGALTCQPYLGLQ